jgi:hypothetical protein
MNRRYSDIYRQFCEGVETTAQEKLGHLLSDEVRLGIWNAGSLMMLESIEQDIIDLWNVAEVEVELSKLAKAFEPNFQEALVQLSNRIGRLLNRDLSDRERVSLSKLPTVAEVAITLDRLTEAAPVEREELLQQILDYL